MALRLVTRTRPRRANILGLIPALTAVGSGAAANPNFSGVLSGDTPSLITIAGGSFDPGGTPGAVVGHVGSYTDFDLATYPIYSISFEHNDYGIHFNGDGTGTGSSTHHPTGWPLGGAWSRMTPPTVDGLERGIEISANRLTRNGTLGMREINIRKEWRGSSEMGSRWFGAKWDLIYFYPTLNVNGNDGNNRPILYAGRVDSLRANTIVFGLANGTVQAWGGSGYISAFPPLTPFRESTNNHLWYMVNDADSAANGTLFGRPAVPSSEVLTFEHRIDSRPTVAYPDGFIGLRVYRQNGVVLVEAGRPYRISNGIDPASATLNSYVIYIQQLGCGQYNTAPPAHENLFMDVGGYLTIGRELSVFHPELASGIGYWMGPRI